MGIQQTWKNDGSLLESEVAISTNLWGINMSRWWFQPIWKTLVKLDHFPNFRDNNKKYLKPPPRYVLGPAYSHWFTVDLVTVCLGSLHTNEFRLFSHCGESWFWQAPMYAHNPKLRSLHCKHIFLPLYGLLVDQCSKTTTCSIFGTMKYCLVKSWSFLTVQKKTQLGLAEQLHPPLIQAQSVNCWTSFVQKNRLQKVVMNKIKSLTYHLNIYLVESS